MAVPLLALWPLLFGHAADPALTESGLLLSARPGWLPGSTSLDLDVGVTTQALGHLAAEQWLAGTVPWWNPYNGIGLPLAGELQNSALFLPFVLLLHFADGPMLMKTSLEVLTGLATYGLLRSLAISRLASCLGGVLFELNGAFAWLGHGAVMPIAFLPLFLWGIELCAGERAVWRGVCLIAVAEAMSLIAGFPETAYLDGLLALAWAVCRVATARRRMALAGWIGLGGMSGLLLAAPSLWSFGHMLLNSLPVHDLAAPGPVPEHVNDVMPHTALGQMLFPYLYGPLQAHVPADASGQLVRLVPWSGGYAGLALMVLAVAGLFGRSQRPLRVALAFWLVVCLGHSFNVPGIVWLTRQVPLMMMTIVPRYAVPSWVLAAIVLAMLAVDDAQRGKTPRFGRMMAAALGFCILGLALAWPLVAALLQEIEGYLVWLAAVLAWGTFVAIAVAWLLSRGRRAALFAVLSLDAVAMFSLPMLSGLRDGVLDQPAIDFLRDRTGSSLQRFYGLGRYRPNYGAYFATPQLNDEYVPLPANWGHHVRSALDPGSDPVFFRGDTPGPASARAAALRANRAAFAALGVRWIVAPAAANPFVTAIDLPGGGAPTTGRGLDDGGTLDGLIPAAPTLPARIGAFGVLIGTNWNTADGLIEVELCAAARCAHGTAPLQRAADNQIARITLDTPLERGDDPLRYRVTHTRSRIPFTVWLSPLPTLRLEAAPDIAPPPVAYADRLVEILELPEAAPYFTASGAACRLEHASREALHAWCDGPARLTRRELFYPGWRATVNGEAVPIAAQDDILQRIDLPPGSSEIRFRYAPPYAGLAWAGAALGLALLMLPWGFARRRRSA